MINFCLSVFTSTRAPKILEAVKGSTGNDQRSISSTRSFTKLESFKKSFKEFGYMKTFSLSLNIALRHVNKLDNNYNTLANKFPKRKCEVIYIFSL